ncbi:MAG: glycoside hydrolase family 127 protein, partial [Phycisphaerae bacterium]|nr:glycoside hydrolase family 127 protein [Phycisphaerae bacterium]
MKKMFVFCLILCAIFPPAKGASPKPIRFEKDYPIKAISDDRVRLSDSFWAPRLNANRQAGVPHCMKKLEETGVIGMFRTLNGSKKEGRYKNNPWGCSDAYKTFEALARVNRTGSDAAAGSGGKKQIDEFIKLVAGAQADDGFIFPYLQLYKKDYKHFSAAISRYTETYSMGHLLEMAVQHYENTGSKEALKVANRVVDCIDSYYGVGKKYDHPSGHPEIEIGLMRLYRATGNAKPLRLAKYLIEKAKTVKTTWSQGRPALADDDAVGHVVAMFYLYAGMVDVAQMSGDKALMDLACRKWENIALKRTYIIGSAGHRGHREGFGDAYDLPNDKAYCETCAAIAYVIWNHRMFLATGEAKYVNLMERTLYNGFISGVSLSGDRFYYP